MGIENQLNKLRVRIVEPEGKILEDAKNLVKDLDLNKAIIALGGDGKSPIIVHKHNGKNEIISLNLSKED